MFTFNMKDSQAVIKVMETIKNMEVSGSSDYYNLGEMCAPLFPSLNLCSILS